MPPAATRNACTWLAILAMLALALALALLPTLSHALAPLPTLKEP